MRRPKLRVRQPGRQLLFWRRTWTSSPWTWTQPWPADWSELRQRGWSAPSTRGPRPAKSLRSLCLQNACFCSFRSHLPCWWRGSRGASRVSGLGEESGCCKDSGHRRSGTQRILHTFLSVGVLEVDIADVDDAREPAQPRKEIEQVEVRAVGLNFERHVVVIFARNDRLRSEAADVHVGSGRRTLHQADELVFFLLFRNDGLQRLELLGERVHLRFRFAVTLAVNLKLGDFLIQR